MEAAGFAAQVIILNDSGQIKAGDAPELDCRRACAAHSLAKMQGRMMTFPAGSQKTPNSHYPIW